MKWIVPVVAVSALAMLALPMGVGAQQQTSNAGKFAIVPDSVVSAVWVLDTNTGQVKYCTVASSGTGCTKFGG